MLLPSHGSSFNLLGNFIEWYRHTYIEKKEKDQDSNPRPYLHPRSKIDALDRSATIGRQVL